ILPGVVICALLCSPLGRRNTMILGFSCYLISPFDSLMKNLRSPKMARSILFNIRFRLKLRTNTVVMVCV
ncbi:hypothetical protein BJY52DRAFT_1264545, partial [Lactarius psammicola]